MTGLEWVKQMRGSDNATAGIAFDALATITVPSRIARKAREYIAARDAFENQLAKNGVYPS